MDRVFGPVGDEHLIGLRRQTHLPGVMIRQRLLQLRDTGRWGVVGMTRSHGADRRFLNVPWSIKIGLAQSEVQDIHPQPL